MELPKQFWNSNDYETYLFKKPQFSFSLPKGTKILKEGERTKPKNSTVSIFAHKVSHSIYADSACGSQSPQGSQKQQRLYNLASTDLDAKQLIDISRPGAVLASLIPGSPKVAFALQHCHGEVKPHSLIGFDAVAIFFTDDYEINFYISGVTHPKKITYAEANSFLKKLKEGQSGSNAEEIIQAWKKILSSIQTN